VPEKCQTRDWGQPTILLAPPTPPNQPDAQAFPAVNRKIRPISQLPGSAVPEVRLALLDEGGHAFLLVFEPEAGVEGAALEEQAFVEQLVGGFHEASGQAHVHRLGLAHRSDHRLVHRLDAFPVARDEVGPAEQTWSVPVSPLCPAEVHAKIGLYQVCRLRNRIHPHIIQNGLPFVPSGPKVDWGALKNDRASLAFVCRRKPKKEFCEP